MSDNQIDRNIIKMPFSKAQWFQTFILNMRLPFMVERKHLCKLLYLGGKR